MARKSTIQDAAPANPQTQCRLFSLPGEIRTIIWEMVLYVGDDEEDNTIKVSSRLSAAGDPTVLVLLAACRLINHEAAGIFYDIHKLCFHSCLALPKYMQKLYPPSTRPGMLSTLSRPRLHSIKNITIDSGLPAGLTAACKQLRKLPRLEKLDLELSCPSWYIPEQGLNTELPFLKKAVVKLRSLEAISLRSTQEAGRPRIRMTEQDKEAVRAANDELVKVVLVKKASVWRAKGRYARK